MDLFTKWGFTQDSWKGQRGEYWVIAQFALLLVFVLVPTAPLQAFVPIPAGVVYGTRGLAAVLGLAAAFLLGKGLIDLGKNLTPLPYPLEDSELVQTGVYGIVRHSLYSSLILGTLAAALWQLSLSHLGVSLLLFLVLNAKATQEERWLQDRHPDYADYQQRVKKLIPWVY